MHRLYPPVTDLLSSPMSEHSAPNGLVMLLEDEALIAFDLQAELEDAGYAVAGPFATCASALEWLAGNKPDLAVLDTILKDGPCKDVAVKLAEQSVPFVIYSGHSEDLNALPEFSGATWVEKPAPTQAILDALTGLIATAD
jgi:DNA-binding response OmpR family regulator